MRKTPECIPTLYRTLVAACNEWMMKKEGRECGDPSHHLKDALALRRIAMQLHAWHERECGIDGGCIERDEESGKPEVFERSANARLIACAPEMLDMLKLIVDYADDGVLDFFYSEIGKVKEIITKATTL